MGTQALDGDAPEIGNQSATGATLSSHAFTIATNNLAYWASRDADPEERYRKENQSWARDPELDKGVDEWRSVDLKKGATDARVPFHWVTDLQRDLWKLGYRSIFADKRTGRILANPVPDGTFDDRTERCVRRFQLHSKLARRRRGTEVVEVSPTYAGDITGVVDDDTKREMKVWLENGYTRVLQPFDPEGILTGQRAEGLVCPEFHDVLARTLFERCDHEDLELYGPCAESADPDGHRPRHRSPTWHLAGLACDLNCYSTREPGKAWYSPRSEYKGWPFWEWRRFWDVVHEVGLATSIPENEDPRHVEFHPLLLGRPSYKWTYPPRAVRDLVNHRGGNSKENIRKVWGLAVNARYGWPRPQPRPAGLRGDG